MNWFKKSQRQLLFPNVNWRPGIQNEDFHDPDNDGFHRCAYCNRVMTPEEVEDANDEELWVSKDLHGTSFGAQEYEMQFDDQFLYQKLTAFFDTRDQLVQQQIEVKRQEINAEPFDVPLDWSTKNNLNSEVQTLWDNQDFPGNLTSPHYHTGVMYSSDLQVWSSHWNTFGELNNFLGRNYELIIEKIKGTNQFKQHREKPICPECKDEHLHTCDGCSELIKPNEEGVYFDNENSQIGETRLCQSCWEGGEFDTCYDCGKLIDRDGYDVTVTEGGTYCSDCGAKPLDVKHYNDKLSALGLAQSDLLPIDSKTIKKTLLPFFGTLAAKAIPLEAETVTKMAKRQNIQGDLLNQILFLATRLGKGRPEEVIGYLKRIMESEDDFAERYPLLKKFKNIPVNVSADHNYGTPDVPSITFVMEPSDQLMDFAEFMFPGAGKIWESIKYGHHSGSIAYARVGENDDSSWIINNMQSDADVQSIRGGKREQAANILADIQKGKLKRDKNGEWPENPYIGKHQIQEALAISFWNKTLKHYPAVLLHIVKMVAKSENRSLYITSMEMQKQKWHTIPDRAVDQYERIPRQMGATEEHELMRPESLSDDYYNVLQLASNQWMYRYGSDDPVVDMVAQKWKMDPAMASSFVYWFGAVGGTEEQIYKGLHSGAGPEEMLLA